MKSMTGEIGILYQGGEQVGGFKYWTAIYNRHSGETIVRASKYWFLREVDKGEFIAKFYTDTDSPDLEDGLVYETKVNISPPTCMPNKTYNKMIEMNLGAFQWEPLLINA